MSLPYPMPAAHQVATGVPAEASQPRPYPQLLRGYQHRWWRFLVSLAVVIGCLCVVFLVSAVGFFVVALTGDADLERLLTDMSALARPEFVLLNNLMLAAMIPVAMVGVWVGHQWRPRWVSSVVGGIRWRWLAECTVISLLVMGVSVAVLYALDGVPQGSPEPRALALLLIVFLTTPLQAAGEEYFMRGWMTQSIGSLFARPVVGAVVAGAISATLFAFAHGSQNIWLFADRFAFGVLASLLVWRTGGLEAPVAIHAVNNVIVFVPVILTGGLEESLLISQAPAGLVAVDVLTFVVLAVLVLWRARRRRIQRLYVPEPAPVPVPPPPLAPPPVTTWPPPPATAWPPPPAYSPWAPPSQHPGGAGGSSGPDRFGPG